jgi:repressor LexA
MKKITEKQKKILEYIEFYVRIKGYPPSMREMKDYFNLKSTSTIYSHLKSLEKKGYVELSGKSRGIKILNLDDFGIIKIDGEYINGKINFYNNPLYLKAISGIKISLNNNIYQNIILKEEFDNYSKGMMLIFNKKLEVIGIINIKEVILNENIDWF